MIDLARVWHWYFVTVNVLNSALNWPSDPRLTKILKVKDSLLPLKLCSLNRLAKHNLCTVFPLAQINHLVKYKRPIPTRTDLPFSSTEPDISPFWSDAFKKQRGERAKIAPDCLTAVFLYVCSFYGSVNGNPIAGKAFNPNSVTLVDSGIHCIHCCLLELFVLGLNHGGWCGGCLVRVCREENIHLKLLKAKPYWRLQRTEYYNSCCKILRTRKNMQKSAYSVFALFIHHLYITVCCLAVILHNMF